VERWIVRPGETPGLGRRDPAATSGAPGDEEITRACFDRLSDDLFHLQDRLRAEQRRSLLVVLQGMDASGKDGTIKHVFRGMNPTGVHVTSFKQPREDELAHDFLWRVHKVTPAKGQVGIFNRSHYEDVLVVRVHELVPEEVWRPRYRHINAFEANIADAGTRIIKLHLQISREEQARRLLARLDRPDKRWKFRAADLDERAHWDDYMAAYEEAIARTSTDHAPWYVVPADHKWFRNWAVSRIVIETLEEMDPQYPPPEEDLEGVRVV
jgi:PPK2 family polyphosphate:nucleotide phosphotransferase